MADRQVGISVKTTVNDSQLRGLKDSFRGVTREMGSDMDELSARTQKYLENLRRAQEVGVTPAYRQQLRQLMRAAQAELAKGKPPKSSRELFRFLRELIG